MPKVMKKLRVCSLLITGAALVFGLATAQAQPYTYFDVADGFYHLPSGTANTYNTSTGSSTDYTGYTDGTPLWRFRDTSGPGVPSFGSSAYDGRFVGPDPALYTLLSGLEPNTEYLSVRVYGVYPRTVTNTSNIPRYGAEFSLDAGATWSDVDSHMAGSYTWVDNSSGLGAVLPVPGTGDTRFFSWLPSVTTDANGVARIDVRIPQYLSDNTLQDRFILDGYAVAIPEPSILALAGLSIVAFLTLRRRR